MFDLPKLWPIRLVHKRLARRTPCGRSGPKRRPVRGALERLEDRQLLSLAGALEPNAAAQSADDDAASNSSPSQAGVATEEGTWRSAVFHERKLGTLGFGFSRNVATVDPLGFPKDINTPRYGPLRSVVETNAWSVAVPGVGNVEVFGAGWDLDGTTPLALVLNKTRNELIFYRGASFELQNSVRYGVLGYQDLMLGSVPGFRYQPRGAIVHEGLVVIQAQRDRLEEGVWIAEGISFLWTQDYGVTFQRVAQVGGGFDVPPIAGHVSDGMDRGQVWAFSNAFPEQSVDDQLGAWFPWSDYIHKSGTPKGGQVGLFRARRAAVGQPWVVEPNRLVYERWELADSGGHHVHSSGMFVDGMASFWGDVGYRNMMVRHVASDLENYANGAWMNMVEFQGAWSPDDAKVYNYGNQAASVAPGANLGEILTTGDVQNEVIMRVDRPANIGDTAIITNLRGTAQGTGAGSGAEGRISLWIHHLRGRGYVVREANSGSSGGQLTMHYSADGVLWASAPIAGSGRPYLYGDQWILALEGNLYAANRPDDALPMRPLLVSPGGTNLSNGTWAEVEPPESGWTYRGVVIEEGVYKYADDGALLDPQPNGLPPVLGSMPLWEITTDGTHSQGGRRALAHLESDQSELHWLTTWYYSLSGDGIEPSLRFGTPGADKQTDRSATLWMANNHWLPGVHPGTPADDNSFLSATLLQVFDGESSDKTAARRWLMAGEGFSVGAAPTYPLAPASTGSNERAVIDDFETGPEWTVALVFGLPEVSAFSFQSDPAGDQTNRPIATLMQTLADRVEIYYTGANRTIWIDVYSRGFLIQKLIFPQVYLDEQDKVNLVLSSDNAEFGATLQSMRNGYPITQQIQTSNGSIQPTRILLSNANQSVVTPLEWYSIQVNESVALDASQRADFLVSDQMFHVLDAGGRPGDMDLNGFVDFDDIDDFAQALNDQAAYQAMFTVPASLHGDADGDGDLDVDDIDDMAAIFAGAPTRGDLDMDDDVDFDDIDELVLALIDPDAYENLFGVPGSRNGDMDRDRDLDFDDVDNFVALLGAIALSKVPDAASIQHIDPLDLDPAAEALNSDFDDLDQLLTLLAVSATENWLGMASQP